MKIVIGDTTYEKFAKLSFDPQTDLSGSELVINQFSADIITRDTITAGTAIQLFDDSEQLWADYWLVEATRINVETVQIIAQSNVLFLDKRTMAAKYYDSVSASTAVAEVFNGLSVSYELDTALQNVAITGFCPDQAARERLQWIVFVIGGYVQTYFSDKIKIKLIDTTETDIPKNKTYWKPSVKYGNYVTSVKITAYTFTVGTPQTTDIWVTDGTNYYIQTTQEYTLSNPDIPTDTPENVVTVDDVGLVNTSNVATLLAQLSQYYFKRVEVDLEAVDNGEYIPGDKVMGYADEKWLVEGYINSATFTFGLQSKAKLHIKQTDTVEGDTLTIIYFYGNSRLDTVEYFLPIGYAYTIDNPYLDIVNGECRRVYMPKNTSTSGVVVSGGVTDNEYYDIALEYESQRLRIYSVDEVSQSNTTVRIS